jgi:Zn-dependent peptidase ImmA (M78 family)
MTITNAAAKPNDCWESEVDDLARSWQRKLWSERRELWHGNVPEDRLQLLDPGVALVSIGFAVDGEWSLGIQSFNGIRAEVAGQIDRDQKLVTIAQHYPYEVQRFTLAHELCHALRHPNGGTMHRDLPLEKSAGRRNQQEIEANRFASMFLMPTRAMLHRFDECFRIPQIQMKDEVAYALCNAGVEKVRWRCKNRRGLSLMIAGTCSFNGRYFKSLASQFRVSLTAMAIRLEELDLVVF